MNFNFVKLMLHIRDEKLYHFVFSNDFSNNPEIIEYILSHINKEGNPPYGDIFLKGLLDSTDDPVKKWEIYKLLSNYGEKVVDDKEIERLEDFSLEIRLCIIYIIGKLKLKKFFQLLYYYYKKADNKREKKEIIRALGESDDIIVLRFLEELLKEKDEFILSETIMVLKKFKAYRLLFFLIRSNNPTIRMNVAGVISSLVPDNKQEFFQLLNVLEYLLDDNNDIVRLVTLKGITISNDKIFIKLLKLFDDMNPFYFQHIANALTRIIKHNEDIKQEFINIFREFLISEVLKAIKYLKNDDIIVSLQKSLLYNNQDIEKIKLYFEIQAKTIQDKHIELLPVFLDNLSASLKQIFMSKLENIVVYSDISEFKYNISKYAKFIIGIIGKSRLNELSECLYIFMHSNQREFFIYSLISLIEMQDSRAYKFLDEHYSLFDDKVKEMLINNLLKVGNTQFIEIIVRDFDKVEYNTKIFILKYMLYCDTKKYIEWCVERFENEKDINIKIFLIRILVNLDSNMALKFIENIKLDFENVDGLTLEVLKIRYELGDKKVLDKFKELLNIYIDDIEKYKNILRSMVEILDIDIYYFLLQLLLNNDKYSNYLLIILLKKKSIYLTNAIKRIIEK